MAEHSDFEEIYRRVGSVEDEIKGLRAWRHDVVSQQLNSNTLRITSLEQDVKMIREKQEHQTEISSDCLKSSQRIEDAILGTPATPGISEQVRHLAFKDTRRDRWTWLIVTVFVGQIGVGLTWFVGWVSKQGGH